MADNFNFTEGSGETGATKEIAGVHYPKVIPTEIDGSDSAIAVKLGALTETAPATDTASSGLNGRLQRIAQRVSSLIALIPAALTGSGNFKVSLQESNASQVVTGTFWQATQPVSEADGANVTLGAKADAKSTATDTTAVSIMSVLKQVSASVQAIATAIAGTLTVGLPSGASTSANQTTIIGHLDGVETLLTAIDGHVDGLEGSNSAIQTAVQLIDDTVTTLGTDTYTEATSKGLTVGAVRRDADTTLVNTTNEFGPLQMDAHGRLKVEAFSGEALPITDNAGAISVDWNGTTPVTGSGNATGALRVELPTNGTGIVGLAAGTNGIGKLTANSGVDIGDVDVVALTGSTIAHDGVDSGNPHKIGARAETSPKGITPVADADRTDLLADSDGMLMVKLNTSGADLISERVSNTDGNSTAFSNFGAVANTYNYVTAIHAFRTDAGTTPIYIDFRTGTAGAILYSVVLPPNGGVVLPAAGTPYFKTAVNNALAFDVSAATTTVYISITGFQSKV